MCESYTQKDPNGRPSPASFALTPSTARTASGVSMLCRDSCRAFGLLEKRKHDSVQYVYALHVGRGRDVRSNAGLGLRPWNSYIYRVLVSRKLEADSVYPVTVRSGLHTLLVHRQPNLNAAGVNGGSTALTTELCPALALVFSATDELPCCQCRVAALSNPGSLIRLW